MTAAPLSRGKRVLRVASAQYALAPPPSWEHWCARTDHWVREATSAGAGLLVFPEYGALELAALVARRAPGEDDASLLRRQAEGVQPFLSGFLALFQEISHRTGTTILAPSLPVRQGDGRIRNVAYLATPDGVLGSQDKLIPTCYERATGMIAPGSGVQVFPTPHGRIGIAICYDIEFPLIGRTLAEAGAEIILAPSCTDTPAGHARVRIGCQARALENQCIVVQAVTVGQSGWCPAVQHNTGAAGVFVPPDVGMPDDGVVIQGTRDRPQWVMADINLNAVAATRRHGRVRPFHHWPEQIARTVMAP